MVRSDGEAAPAAAAEIMLDGELAGLARQLLSERRLRTGFLPAELFGERAWELLLELYAEGGAEGAAEAELEPLLRHGIAAPGPAGPELTADGRASIAKLLQEIWFHRASGESPALATGHAEAAGRLDALLATLRSCQMELDALQLWQPGADVSQAIEALKAIRLQDPFS